MIALTKHLVLLMFFIIACDCLKITIPMLNQTTVFTSGLGKYHTYRIPAMVCTPSGVILAFCEGRLQNGGDYGKHDILLRRSFDGGLTWGPLQMVATDPWQTTYSNPQPVFEEQYGRVILLYSINSTSAAQVNSENYGETWSKPIDITKQVKNPQWGWHLWGLPNGIQMSGNGRLVMPFYYGFKKRTLIVEVQTTEADHWRMDGSHSKNLVRIKEETIDPKEWEVVSSHDFNTGYLWASTFHSAVAVSDDFGDTWGIEGSVPQRAGSECNVVEIEKGVLLLNARVANEKGECRRFSSSVDEGRTWSSYGTKYVKDCIPSPHVQGSTLCMKSSKTNSTCDVLLLANPWSSTNRVDMVVSSIPSGSTVTQDEYHLNTNAAAYSALSQISEAMAGILYEQGGYNTITFARFHVAYSNGKKS